MGLIGLINYGFKLFLNWFYFESNLSSTAFISIFKYCITSSLRFVQFSLAAKLILVFLCFSGILLFLFASQKCQQSQGSEWSWSRNAEQSSLLNSHRVFASQKCQQSQGSGGSCSRNAKPDNSTFKGFLLYTLFKPFRVPFTDIKK